MDNAFTSSNTATMSSEKQSPGLARNDPRSSSQQSLLPENDEFKERRKLMLIYIHGFMGNEASFQSFPAHVHHLLTLFLAETHVVHTKMYPRYPSKRNISFARDNFSKWLAPHEADTTDVILLGHSMGGLLAADVVLAPPSPPSDYVFRHHILGIINFDVPFLGMHPGVIKSGLASLFNPAKEPKPNDKTSTPSADSGSPANLESAVEAAVIASSAEADDESWLDKPDDPNFDPAYSNDVKLPVRTGWRNAVHWLSKHSGNLKEATQQLVTSHMEFGGAMAHYSELKLRYARVRALEETDIRVRKSVVQEGALPDRVRFVNYYTVCFGRPKKPKVQREKSNSKTLTSENRQSEFSRSSSNVEDEAEHDHEDLEDHPDSARLDEAIDSLDLSELDPSPTPDPPVKPPPLDVSFIHDPAIRRLVEQEHARATAAYEKAVAEQSRTSKAPTPSIQPPPEPSQPPPPKPLTHREREQQRLEREAERMAAESRRLRGEPTDPSPGRSTSSLSVVSTTNTLTPTTSNTNTNNTTSNNTLTPSITATSTSSSSAHLTPPALPPRAAKERHFCALPPHDSAGQRDPCWERVEMGWVDEVAAHCGLFEAPKRRGGGGSGGGGEGEVEGEVRRQQQQQQRYERLVGDVAERIEMWVGEAQTERMLARAAGGRET